MVIRKWIDSRNLNALVCGLCIDREGAEAPTSAIK